MKELETDIAVFKILSGGVIQEVLDNTVAIGLSARPQIRLKPFTVTDSRSKCRRTEFARDWLCCQSRVMQTAIDLRP